MVSYNMFAYCLNNPINYIDKGGNSPSIIVVVIVAALLVTTNTASDPQTVSVYNSKSNRKPGKTPPSKWPELPENLAGKNPKWNPEGYWEGKYGGRYTWDNRSHGSGVNRGNGAQDGHWDDEKSGNRWDRNGNLLGQHQSLSPEAPVVPINESSIGTIVVSGAAFIFAIGYYLLFGDPSMFQYAFK